MRDRVPSDVVARLRRVPLFSLLSTKGLRVIAGAAAELDIVAGEVLVTEGATDRDLYVILRGEATVVRGGTVITTLGVGDFFGEFALLSGEPRAADVTAAIDMRVLILSHEAMDQAIRREPLLASRMLDAMARRAAQNERTSAY